MEGVKFHGTDCSTDHCRGSHVRNPGSDCWIVGNVQPEHQGKDRGSRPARHCPVGHQERDPSDVPPHSLRAAAVAKRRTPAQRTGHRGGMSDKSPPALQLLPGGAESGGVPDAQASWQPTPQAQHYHCPGGHWGHPRHHDRCCWRG